MAVHLQRTIPEHPRLFLEAGEGIEFREEPHDNIRKSIPHVLICGAEREKQVETLAKPHVLAFGDLDVFHVIPAGGVKRLVEKLLLCGWLIHWGEVGVKLPPKQEAMWMASCIVVGTYQFFFGCL